MGERCIRTMAANISHMPTPVAGAATRRAQLWKAPLAVDEEPIDDDIKALKAK